MKKGKWISVAAVSRAAIVLSPVIIKRWNDCPPRLIAICDDLIGGGETAAATGSPACVSADLLESTTMLVGAFHLRSQGYESKIPELWVGDDDVKDALPDSTELEYGIRNWLDTACRCSRAALEMDASAAIYESHAGISWAMATLNDLAESNATNELTQNLRDLEAALNARRSAANLTCQFRDGRWYFGRAKPWYRKLFR